MKILTISRQTLLMTVNCNDLQPYKQRKQQIRCRHRHAHIRTHECAISLHLLICIFFSSSWLCSTTSCSCRCTTPLGRHICTLTWGWWGSNSRWCWLLRWCSFCWWWEWLTQLLLFLACWLQDEKIRMLRSIHPPWGKTPGPCPGRKSIPFLKLALAF